MKLFLQVTVRTANLVGNFFDLFVVGGILCKIHDVFRNLLLVDQVEHEFLGIVDLLGCFLSDCNQEKNVLLLLAQTVAVYTEFFPHLYFRFFNLVNFAAIELLELPDDNGINQFVEL